MFTDVDNVETIRTDAVKAAEIRAEMTPLLEQVCLILNRARAEGLTVGFSCNPDQYGRYRPDIGVLKPL